MAAEIKTDIDMKKELSSRKYNCIFFDLDHTLWDFETNSRETLQELYGAYSLDARGIPSVGEFQRQFRIVNEQLWDLYDRGVIGSEVIRQERFKNILSSFQVHDEALCTSLSQDYLYACPKKGNLMPGAIEILEYLAGSYNLTVITNGFDEIQQVKLASRNLQNYFDHIITSQKAGHRKPAREIFDFALQANGVRHHEAIMIGDNLVADIGGARNAAIDAVFFNPEKTAHSVALDYEITMLDELRQIL